MSTRRHVLLMEVSGDLPKPLQQSTTVLAQVV